MRELTRGLTSQQVGAQICVDDTETQPGEKRRKLDLAVLLTEVGLRDRQEPLSF